MKYTTNVISDTGKLSAVFELGVTEITVTVQNIVYEMIYKNKFEKPLADMICNLKVVPRIRFHERYMLLYAKGLPNIYFLKKSIKQTTVGFSGTDLILIEFEFCEMVYVNIAGKKYKLDLAKHKMAIQTFKAMIPTSTIDVKVDDEWCDLNVTYDGKCFNIRGSLWDRRFYIYLC